MPRGFAELKTLYESWLGKVPLPESTVLLAWLDELAAKNTRASKRLLSQFFNSGRTLIAGHFFEGLNGRQVALRHRLLEIDPGQFFSTVVANKHLLAIFCHRSRYSGVNLSEHSRAKGIVLLRNAILYYPGYDDRDVRRSIKLLKDMQKFYQFIESTSALVSKAFEPNMLVSLDVLSDSLVRVNAHLARLEEGASAAVAGEDAEVSVTSDAKP